MSDDFFEEQEEQSRVKAEIVAKYFAAWAAVMATRSQRIGYLDLFCGPGRYRSGEQSTPLLILEQAIASDVLRRSFDATFNDADPALIASLEREARQLPGYDALTHQPQFTTGSVDDSQMRVIDRYQSFPTLTFLDPWGYKGLSRRLIAAAVRGWGCEVVFFFNYNRIQAAINNDLVEAHMERWFAPAGLALLRTEIAGKSSQERERWILASMAEVVRALAPVELIPFRFARAGGATSHYIVFATKSPLGYKIMKDVMAKQGLLDPDGVPAFEYIPGLAGQQLALLAQRPLQALPGQLLEEFAGRTLVVKDVISEHQFGRPFIERNYRQVLLELEGTGRITCNRAARARQGKMGDKTVVTFPAR